MTSPSHGRESIGYSFAQQQRKAEMIVPIGGQDFRPQVNRVSLFIAVVSLKQIQSCGRARRRR